MDLKETQILGDTITEHWYYRSKAKAMASLLGAVNISSILDIGAGSGFFSRYLLANTTAQNATCVDISYEQDSVDHERGKPMHFQRALGQSNADVVLLMDVLEHVKDDVGLLTEYVNKVPSGTVFLISVPAFQFLWSNHDVFLEHERRYRLLEVELLAQKAGLHLDKSGYFFATIFPLVAAIRLAVQKLRNKAASPQSDLSVAPPWINGTLTLLCGLEVPLIRFNRIAGLTVFCVAKKP
jgi:SAM-dependent methyltransferase